MKTARRSKTPIRFIELPESYAGLCANHLPRPIHDAMDYANTAEMAARFAGFEAAMNADQSDYFKLLCTLMEEWEKKSLKQRKVSGTKMLTHLFSEHGLCGADLSRILGCSRQLGPMILRGEREITAEHARTLGKHFRVNPGLFIA